MLASLRPGAAALDIHVDVERESRDWPLLGFILMIDAFTPDNGATRFSPGSHRWGDAPKDGRVQAYARNWSRACGPAGTLPGVGRRPVERHGQALLFMRSRR